MSAALAELAHPHDPQRDEVPVAFGLESESLTDLDKKILTALGHIEEIFRKPHRRLRQTEELELVARAKRPASRAIPVLSARTQDWARRTVIGVQPMRVLTRRSESDLDIYENRLAVGLLTALLGYLHERMDPLEDKVIALEQFEYMRSQLGDLSWRVAHDTYARLARALETSEDLIATLQKLRAARARLNALRGTEMTRSLQNSAAGGDELIVTNLLREDQHYRFVAALWEDLNRRAALAQRSADEQREEFRRTAEQFDAYCRSLTVAALHEVGTPTRSSGGAISQVFNVVDGVTVVLSQSDTGITVTTTVSHGLNAPEVVQDEGKPLALVSLPATPTTSDCREALLKASGDRPTAVLYADSKFPRGEAEPVSDWALGRFRLGIDDELSLVPVAPASIRSVERLGQVILRSMVMNCVEFGFKPLVVPEALQPAASSAGLISTGRPGEYRVQSPSQALAGHSQDFVFADYARTHARGTPVERDHAMRDAQATDAATRQRINALSILTRCPTCRARLAPSSFEAEGSWQAACKTCGTSVSLRACQSCRHPVFGVTSPAEYPEERLDVEWPTRWAGAAVVAGPCWIRKDVFVCDACGRCASPSPGCLRCESRTQLQESPR